MIKNYFYITVLFVSGLQYSFAKDTGVHEINFELEWDEFQPSLVDVRGITQDAPAGKHGNVIAKGDKLYFSDGTPAKFWGVGLTFANKKPYQFPPDKKTSDKLVNRLSRLGFNHVRFVGLDSSGRMPLKNWMKSGAINDSDLDALGYLIHKLKENGIYYSFSINNNSPVLLNATDGISANKKSKTKLWRYKYTRIYNDNAITRVSDWFKAFYGWKNPYTGLSIAEDPANIYLAAVNEDSIFTAYFSDFKFIDDKNNNDLDKLFEDFLNEKYGSLLLAEKEWRKKSNHKDCHIKQTGKIKNILTKKGSSINCPARQVDNVEFLITVDMRFYQRIRDAVRSVGYKGLFTGTNNWYGYGSLYANASVGDYIEAHGYFDHSKRKKILGDVVEGILGHSYVQRKQKKKSSIEDEHSYPFSKTFRMSLEDKPMIISEWGHSAWGKYSYEGLAIMATYSSLQGYPVVDAHTYFNHPNPDPKEVVTRKSMAVSTNPILHTLLPSFSIAFLRGDIKESDSRVINTCSVSKSEYYQFVQNSGYKRKDGVCGIYNQTGYQRKVRTRLVGKNQNKIKSKYVRKINQYISDTGEIVWSGIQDENDYLTVDTDMFKLLTKPNKGLVTTSSGISVDFKSHGIISIVSLDHLPINSFNKVLVSLAQSFKNTDMAQYKVGRRSWISDTGTLPARLSIPEVQLSMEFDSSFKEDVGVCALKADGTAEDIGNLEFSKIANGRLFSVSLGKHGAPWYLLQKRSTFECGVSK